MTWYKQDLISSQMVMPSDLNPDGQGFGGYIFSQMDLAGLYCATRETKKKCVTKAVNNLSFGNPLYIGEMLRVYVSTVKHGETSITYYLEAESECIEGIKRQIASGTFVYVCVSRYTNKSLKLNEKDVPPEVTRDGCSSTDLAK